MTERVIKPKPSRTEHRSGFENGTQKEAEGHGGLHLVPGVMQPANKVPCVECPIRRTATPGYLGGYTPEMYVEVMHSPGSIACHMSPGFAERDIGRQKHCTGVSGYRANVGHICQHHGQQTNAHKSTQLVGSDYDLYFGSPEEFIAHHGPAQKKTQE